VTIEVSVVTEMVIEDQVWLSASDQWLVWLTRVRIRVSCQYAS